MKTEFWKYHGCGNDFIIVRDQKNFDYPNMARKLCHRVLGIGADGLIGVKTGPFEMLFFNADGSRGTMCGNGMRCFAKFCIDEKLISSDFFEVLTLAGSIPVEVLSEDTFLVHLGKPDFASSTMKMNTPLAEFVDQPFYGLSVTAVFTGTVHAVTFIPKLDTELLNDVAVKISNDPVFFDRANVNFVQILDDKNFLVRTYERGVGWTYACGTGAAACYAVGKRMKICDKSVTIHFPFGSLLIEEKETGHLSMSGKAVKIASGIAVIE